MDQPDPDVADLDHPLLGKQRAQLRVVLIAAHGDHGRPEGFELDEHRPRHEVAGVHDQVGRAEPIDARAGQLPAAPGQVRVGDDRELRRGRQGVSGPVRSGEAPARGTHAEYLRAAGRGQSGAVGFALRVW
jgi:hypothetical protein